MKNKLYLAYGSNMNLPQMAYRCPTAKVVGISEIKDYALVFRGGRSGAVATIERQKGGSVPVMLWKIQQRDELALDNYEGYPNFYDKQTLEVEVNGECVSAMVYVMTPGHTIGMPSQYYYDVIKEGYKSAGIDTAILDNAVEHTVQMMDSEPEPEQVNPFCGMKWW